MKEWTKFLILVGVFLVLYFLPLDTPMVWSALTEGLNLLQEYARLHVLTCLVPAFFIAGTIAVYVKKEAVMQVLGPATKKYIAYPVASLSGGILAVCSCTILPLFTGIYKRGAGIGPAAAFLFTGPAINITAILLTGSVLGWDFALWRLVAAFIIAQIAGLTMAVIFRRHDKNAGGFQTGMVDDIPYSNSLITVFFVLQLAVLVVFGIDMPAGVKTVAIILLLGALAGITIFKFRKDHTTEWLGQTWDLAKKIIPLLFIGVFVAGMLEVIIPQEFVTQLVGENTVASNAIASTFGAFMYFATLTEVPVIQKLMGLGMNKGPALTLFLTGNALSLPSMIVLFRVMGGRQAATYIVLIIVLSVFAGLLFGSFI